MHVWVCGSPPVRLWICAACVFVIQEDGVSVFKARSTVEALRTFDTVQDHPYTLKRRATLFSVMVLSLPWGFFPRASRSLHRPLDRR